MQSKQSGKSGGAGFKQQGNMNNVKRKRDPNAYRRGDKVEVFFSTGIRDTYMPVDSVGAGSRTPRIGMTRGWIRGTVIRDFELHDERVEVRYTHSKWVDRDGQTLDIYGKNSENALVDQLRPEHVRPAPTVSSDRRTLGGENLDVSLSVLIVRWAGDCPEIKDGEGGWGETGSVVSDSYISTWLTAFQQTFPGDHQIITAYVQCTEDIQQLASAGGTLSRIMEGRHKAAFYFVWPVNFSDNSAEAVDYPGYVEQSVTLSCLGQLEAAGISTRFPYSSHLYRVFLAKDWMAHMCLAPAFKCTPTTKITRSMIECDPLKAANSALRALHRIREVQRSMLPASLRMAAGEIAHHEPSLGAKTQWHEMKGVAKLGFSWEAMSVRRFDGAQQLSRQLERLVNTGNGTSNAVLVQDMVENFDCEIRTFVVEGKPHSQRRFFTQFEERGTGGDDPDDGKYTDFNRCGRERGLETYFHGDERALADAEKQIDELICLWVDWLLCEAAELPPVFRFDAFVRRRPCGGRSDVFTGELTELGACTLGWPKDDMIATLYPAVLRACTNDHGNCRNGKVECACRNRNAICLRSKQANTKHFGGSHDEPMKQ